MHIWWKNCYFFNVFDSLQLVSSNSFYRQSNVYGKGLKLGQNEKLQSSRLKMYPNHITRCQLFPQNQKPSGPFTYHHPSRKLPPIRTSLSLHHSSNSETLQQFKFSPYGQAGSAFYRPSRLVYSTNIARSFKCVTGLGSAMRRPMSLFSPIRKLVWSFQMLRVARYIATRQGRAQLVKRFILKVQWQSK